MQRSYGTQKGFTIVELLVVIVVIAILAVISVVVYNGVQERARNSQTTSTIATYAKAIKSFFAANQRYPGPSAPPAVVACLGSSPTCANITDNTGACFGVTQAVQNTQFTNDMKTMLSSLPEPSDTELNCNGKKYRGAFYTTYGTRILLYSLLKGVSSCPEVSGVRILGPNSGTFGDGYACVYEMADS